MVKMEKNGENGEKWRKMEKMEKMQGRFFPPFFLFSHTPDTDVVFFFAHVEKLYPQYGRKL